MIMGKLLREKKQRRVLCVLLNFCLIWRMHLFCPWRHHSHWWHHYSLAHCSENTEQVLSRWTQSQSAALKSYIQSAQIYPKKVKLLALSSKRRCLLRGQMIYARRAKAFLFLFQKQNQSPLKQNYISLFSGNFGKHFNSPSVAPGIQI